MDHDDPAEALTALRERRPGLVEILQAAAGSGLAAYAVWALLLQPGFRRVPLRLQVRRGALEGAGTKTGARRGSMGGIKAPVGGWKRWAGPITVPGPNQRTKCTGGGTNMLQGLGLPS